MPDNADLRRYLVAFLTIVMFLAGFALADVLLFESGTMPEGLKGFAGLLVCSAAGVYVALLFNRQNRK